MAHWLVACARGCRWQRPGPTDHVGLARALGVHEMRTAWAVLVLQLAVGGCAVSRDGVSHLPAAGGPAAHGGSGRAGGSARAGGSGRAGDGAGAAAGADSPVAVTCDAPRCGTEGAPLAAYCKLEHAHCPTSMAEAKASACANAYVQTRVSLTNGCGGDSVRVRYAYGTATFHFNATGTLSAVVTQTETRGGACDAKEYLYGMQQCNSVGNEAPLSCMN
jgi:hypothetical protein